MQGQRLAPTSSTAITLATITWQLTLGTYNINSNYFGNNHLATNTWHLQHQLQLLWQQPPGNYHFAPTTSSSTTLLWQQQPVNNHLESTTCQQQHGNIYLSSNNLATTTWNQPSGNNPLARTTWQQPLFNNHLETTIWQ